MIRKLIPLIGMSIFMCGCPPAKAKALEKQGRNIVHLEIGEPDFDTPNNIKEPAIKAMKGGYTHYVPAAGIPELRTAIAIPVEKPRHQR